MYSVTSNTGYTNKTLLEKILSELGIIKDNVVNSILPYIHTIKHSQYISVVINESDLYLDGVLVSSDINTIVVDNDKLTIVSFTGWFNVNTCELNRISIVVK